MPWLTIRVIGILNKLHIHDKTIDLQIATFRILALKRDVWIAQPTLYELFIWIFVFG